MFFQIIRKSKLVLRKILTAIIFLFFITYYHNLYKCTGRFLDENNSECLTNFTETNTEDLSFTVFFNDKYDIKMHCECYIQPNNGKLCKTMQKKILNELKIKNYPENFTTIFVKCHECHESHTENKYKLFINIQYNVIISNKVYDQEEFYKKLESDLISILHKNYFSEHFSLQYENIYTIKFELIKKTFKFRNFHKQYSQNT